VGQLGLTARCGTPSLGASAETSTEETYVGAAGTASLPSFTRRRVLPVTRCRRGRGAATLIWACPAISATVAPMGSAVSVARTAAVGLSPADAER
jgi:hypothetical protein